MPRRCGRHESDNVDGGPTVGMVRRGRAVWLIATALAIASTHSSALAGVQLTPDLQTMTPRDIKIQVTSSGQRRLRFSNEVANTGGGVVELRPRAEDCNRDGDRENDRTAYQRIYEDANGNGTFERDVDTAYTDVRSGCMVYHRAHNHWHFGAFARYELKRLSDRVTVRSSKKVGFCVIDIARRYPDLPGSAGDRYYSGCSRNAPQGISVGWADIYDASLAGQWIVINRVPNGNYCVASTADPLNQIVEAHDGNNTGARAIRIERNRVTPLSVSC
jgi:hypothetical protein